VRRLIDTWRLASRVGRTLLPGFRIVMWIAWKRRVAPRLPSERQWLDMNGWTGDFIYGQGASDLHDVPLCLGPRIALRKSGCGSRAGPGRRPIALCVHFSCRSISIPTGRAPANGLLPLTCAKELRCPRPLLHDPVSGGKKCARHSQAKRSGRREVDDSLKPSRRLDR
jgi:hypothetical protein